MARSNIKGSLERRKTSKWWYGSYRFDGRRKTVNLHIEVRGTPPGLGEIYGSAQFERSKGEAESALQALLADVNGSRKTEEFAQAVHEARTGRKVKSHKISDLSGLWENKPRNKPVSKKHARNCLNILHGFREWCIAHYPEATKLDHVSNEMAKEFLNWHTDRGIAPRTWNVVLTTMKAACRQGDCFAFDNIPQKPNDHVHRVPFTPNELADVLNTARADKLLYPLVVTAACTAMRKGDCCRLRWRDVDLQGGYITVKTSKTGRNVDIPLADLLRFEIEKQRGNGSDYIFPQLAEQYEKNQQVLATRFKKILARTGFHDGKPQLETLKKYDPADLEMKARNYCKTIPTEKKRQRVEAAFFSYLSHQSLTKVAKETGIPKGTVSAYLNEIEEAAGIAFIRGKRRVVLNLPPTRGRTVAKREMGIRKASVRDFHALRTTWITLALMQGLPLELVQTVTGHATAEVVMEHYFKPQREQLKAALQKCMPAMLTSSTRAPIPPWAITLIEKQTAKNWRSIRDKLISEASDIRDSG